MVGITAVSSEQPDDLVGEPLYAERVDLIDDADRVVGVATRAEMRAGRLLHRAVAVAVLSSEGQLLVHRRADHKDLWPGRWDIAAGGVVAAGEGYAASARRELAEELGVDLADGSVELVEIGEGTYRDADVALRCRCYVVAHDGPFRFSDGEVTEVRWMALAELDAHVGAQHAPSRSVWFVPDSISIMWPLVRPLLVARIGLH